MIDGHKKPSPNGSSHAVAVSRESARIFFVHAILNGLEVFINEIMNDYLQDPSSEKYQIMCGT